MAQLIRDGHSLSAVAWRLGQGARAFHRRHGPWGWSLLACALVALSCWALDAAARRQASLLQAQLVAASQTPARPVLAQGVHAERARLQAFEQALLPHDEIAGVVQDLLRLAAKHGLEVRRGQYRGQTDLAGAFFRYRMALPVEGSPAAVHAFMREALRTHQPLALESVQLRRERGAAEALQVSLHWVLLARLPAHGAGAPEAQVQP